MTLQIAMDLAVQYHNGQYRKHPIGGIFLPYICHCFAVMELVWKWGVGDEATLKAAVAHDVLEDSDCSKNVLYSFLGSTAAGYVNDLSFIPPDDKTKEEVRILKEAYLASFDEKPIEVVVIKKADRILNGLDFHLADPAYASKYFFQKGKPLFDIYERRRSEVVERFGEKVDQNIRETFEAASKIIRNGGCGVLKVG